MERVNIEFYPLTNFYYLYESQVVSLLRFAVLAVIGNAMNEEILSNQQRRW